MSTFRSTALVLRGYDFSEADRILVVFTEQNGKLRALVKGVKRPKSRLASAVGLVTLAEIQFYGKAQRELYLITQAQVLTAFPAIKSDLKSLALAGRMCELIEHLVPEQEPHPEIFKLITDAMNYMESGGDPVICSLWFEIAFLDKMGYRPGFDSCMQCGKPAERVCFSPDIGGVVCPTCHPDKGTPLSAGSRILFGKLLTMELNQLSRLRLLPQMAREMAEVLNRMVQYQLGHGLRSDKFRLAVDELTASRKLSQGVNK